MPYVTTSDGVRLYYEETGRGTPIVFAHEFSGDLRSWQLQVSHFRKKFRCVAFNARGYPPSDVPERVSKYSPARAVDDLADVMRHLKLGKAHIIGCSMGSQTTLHLGLTYPRMAISLTAIGAGSGSNHPSRAEQKRASAENARRYEEEGLEAMLARVGKAPNRVLLKHKNPLAWEDFERRFMEHSALGCANIQRGIQGTRAPLMSLGAKFRALKVPTHLVVGDADTGAIEPSLFIKRNCPAARLTIMPATGHLVNAEEPEMFNRLTEMFYADVERAGASGTRVARQSA
jgi:pimeloyl-ACP methyl ester carboxylesterase